MNIFEFAKKMELDGKAYYEKLADETPIAGLKAIFTNLAADELKHYNTIKELQAGSAGVMAETKVLEETKNLFQVLVKDKDTANSLKKSLDGYEHARKVEADSVRFYEDMAKKETNPANAKLIQKIIKEEQAHYNILDNLYDYTLAPQNYLEWAEFSNIKTL